MTGDPAGSVGPSPVVLWDFEGTLAYRTDRWRGALLGALDHADPGHGVVLEDLKPGLRNGFPWHRPEIAHPELTTAELWWTTMAERFNHAYRRAGTSEDVARRAAAGVRTSFLDLTSWTVYGDVRPALGALTAAGWRHVVVSNHVTELAELITALGLADLFELVLTSASTGYEKPNPAMFDLALERAGRPTRVWMVGDNPVADIDGATAAGIPALLVRTADPDGRRRDLMAAADHILASRPPG